MLFGKWFFDFENKNKKTILYCFFVKKAIGKLFSRKQKTIVKVFGIFLKKLFLLMKKTENC